MNFPIDLKTLSNDDLIREYAAVMKSPHEDIEEFESERDSVIALYREEIESRLESADSLGLLAIAQLVDKHFPEAFNLPIRKKITYSPTGRKAAPFLGFFSRKNKGWGVSNW